MKTIILILIATATIARASFIDLTPGGYYYPDHQNQPPGALLRVIHDELSNRISFFDQALPSGWVSQFGVLNGGTLFTTNLVNGDPLSIANVSWDFEGTPYGMRFLDVVGDNNGNIWENIYFVTGRTRFDSDGWLQTLLNGEVIITSISFYGTAPGNNVPDGGSTVMLMGIGLVAITLRKHFSLSK